MKTLWKSLVVSLIALLSTQAFAGFYPTEEEIAQKLTDPVANLVLFPFEFNYDKKIGTLADGTRWTLNLKPHLPIHYDENWLIISKTKLPIIHQEEVFYMAGTQTGLGDTLHSFLISPKSGGPADIRWGFGPIFLFPTGTDTILSRDKFAVGPTGALAYYSGPWTSGITLHHLWSFAGNSLAGAVNETYMEPFVAYTTPMAWTYSLNTEATYDWVSRKWSAPLHGTVNKVLFFRDVHINLGAGFRYWIDSPTTGPKDFGPRFNITLIFMHDN